MPDISGQYTPETAFRNPSRSFAFSATVSRKSPRENGRFRNRWGAAAGHFGAGFFRDSYLAQSMPSPGVRPRQTGRCAAAELDDLPAVRNYFVDETGDADLFSDSGKVKVGTPGCSTHFFLGCVEAQDPDALTRDLTQLRQDLLADPYFRGVPSMQPKAKKTAIFFHAKDDLPEVRREVFLANSCPLRKFVEPARICF